MTLSTNFIEYIINPMLSLILKIRLNEYQYKKTNKRKRGTSKSIVERNIQSACRDEGYMDILGDPK